jgi:hypothetical protein
MHNRNAGLPSRFYLRNPFLLVSSRGFCNRENSKGDCDLPHIPPFKRHVTIVQFHP